MERFSPRESVLLGCSPQRSFMKDHSSSKAVKRSSDIDFKDVFGGPPRRFSMYDTRCNYSESKDDDVFRGEDETFASRNSCNGVREKPLFGKEGLKYRRHYPSENFFDDIFGGNGSLSSSSSSSLDCRVLSPARTLPPRAEPLGTSRSAEFSPPSKLTKGIGLSTFTSAPRSPCKSKDGAPNGFSHFSHPLWRSSSLNRSYEERNDTCSPYRQSILSRVFSLSRRDADTKTGGESKMDSSEFPTTGNQFHFSIYKWASKGASLAMPLWGGASSKPKENHDTDKCPTEGDRELPKEEILHDTKLPSNGGISTDAKSFTTEHDKQNKSIPPDTITEDRVADPCHRSSHKSGEKTKSHLQSEIANGSQAINGGIDESFQGNFQVKEITQKENKLLKTTNDPEESQVIDVKIQKWSIGKEGNIRSLLSTLQYVLWPESGWKSVPLVDIVDGNAVKRSYQKVLLCLHPDKLQQKGATSQQKYIAEKVFGILQGAWTHFNSLGSQ